MTLITLFTINCRSIYDITLFNSINSICPVNVCSRSLSHLSFNWSHTFNVWTQNVTINLTSFVDFKHFQIKSESVSLRQLSFSLNDTIKWTAFKLNRNMHFCNFCKVHFHKEAHFYILFEIMRCRLTEATIKSSQNFCNICKFCIFVNTVTLLQDCSMFCTSGSGRLNMYCLTR